MTFLENEVMTEKTSVERLAYSMREAAQALGICERSVWQLVKDQKLRATRIGRRSVRIPVAELERFIADQPQQD